MDRARVTKPQNQPVSPSFGAKWLPTRNAMRPGGGISLLVKKIHLNTNSIIRGEDTLGNARV